LWRESKKPGADPAPEDASDRAKENIAQYRELRERLQILLGQVKNEKVREAGSIIEIIGSDMERVHPRTWTESRSFYSGHDPQLLIVPRLEQFQVMLNRLLRHDPIDDIVVYSAAEEDEMIAAIRGQQMPRD
jgi:hypothetical protein